MALVETIGKLRSRSSIKGAVQSDAVRGFSEILFALVGVTAVAVSMFFAFVNLRTRFGIGLIEDIRMTLAKFANLGNLYPPLRSGMFYGGSRYMPLPIFLHSSLKQVTGSYLVGGKMLALGAGVLIALLLFFIMRGLGWSRVMSCAFAGVPFASSIVFTATNANAADLLPALLQLSGITLVAFARRRTHLSASGFLCALAVLCKLSAWWAPIAIILWLLLERRGRDARFFAAWFGGVLFFGIVAFQLVTDRTMLLNVLPLAFSGVEGSASVMHAPEKLFMLVRDFAPFLFPIALACGVAGVRAARSGRWPIFLIAFWTCLLVTAVVLTDEGAVGNHLIDLIILGPIALAASWELLWPRGVGDGFVIVAWSLAAIVTTVAVIQSAVPAFQAWREGTYSDTHPVSTLVPPEQPVLSEDPYLATWRGFRPLVLDPFAFHQLSHQRPGYDDTLVDVISAGMYPTVVLNEDLAFLDWYDRFHLSPDVREALAANYALVGREDGYWIYRFQLPAPTTPQPGQAQKGD